MTEELEDRLGLKKFDTLEKALKLEEDYKKVGSQIRKTYDEKRLKVMRQSLLNDIDRQTNLIFTRISAVERDIKNYPILYENKEVWVHGTKIVIGRFTLANFGATKLNKESSEEDARKLELMINFRYEKAETLKERISVLRKGVLEGEFDHILNIRGEVIIYEIMGQSGELLPDLRSYISILNEKKDNSSKPSTDTQNY